MEVINLNLIPTGALPVVHASQYDEGRTFRANLMDGTVVYTLDGTETLECDVKKPDGNIVTVAVNNTSDSYVEIDTTIQMCACAGDSLAELHITKGAQEIGTLNFILAVERSPLEGGIESESEIDNLATQVAGLVASEVENQYDSANVIFDDEPTEGHGNGYTVKSEGIKRAVDNVQNAIDEVNDKADTNAANIGSLSQLTTSVKSSLVGAVNEVNGKLPKQVYKNLNWETVHSFVAEVNTLYLLTADSGNDMAIARIFSNGTTNLGVVSGSKITALSYENGRLKITTNNCGLVAIRIA